MTIIATAPFYQAGALVAAGSTPLNYAAAIEADLVQRGVASYVGGNPQTGGLTPAMMNREGTALVTPGGTVVLENKTGSSIATRIPSGSVDVLTNQLGVTSSVGMRLADNFDAVRLIYLHKGTTQTVGMACAVSVASNLTSQHNSSGTWVTGTMADAAVRVSADEPSINFSSWISISGDNAILYARLYIPSVGNTESSVASLYDNGSADGVVWAGMAGDEFICNKQVGDFASTNQAGFTEAAPKSFSAIAGVQYRSRGVVTTVLGIGDSIMYGTKTLASGDAFWAKAVRALKVAGVKIEACNMAKGGQTTAQYYPRVAGAIAAIKPSVLIYGAYSPNDAATPTAASILAERVLLSTLRDTCRGAGIVLLPVTGMPKATGTYATSIYTNAQDDLRKDVNATVRGLPFYIDLDAAVASSTAKGAASGFANAAYPATDLLHLTEAGNVAATATAYSAIKSAAVV